MRKRKVEDTESGLDDDGWAQVAQDPFTAIINRIDTVFFFLYKKRGHWYGWMAATIWVSMDLPEKEESIRGNEGNDQQHKG